MDKHELTERLARRAHRSIGRTADRLDALIYKLWKEAREPKPNRDETRWPVTSQAPVRKP